MALTRHSARRLHYLFRNALNDKAFVGTSLRLGSAAPASSNVAWRRQQVLVAGRCTTCQQQCAVDRPPLYDAPCLAQALEVVRRLTAPSTSGHYEKVRQANYSSSTCSLPRGALHQDQLAIWLARRAQAPLQRPQHRPLLLLREAASSYNKLFALVTRKERKHSCAENPTA